ncbi:MAG: nucleotidyltransferase domain-containing protein [Defluviitaleaceae bacterium]|nr:nucleotidyltransferase domain-containing protein [Defluviitaleaceae bacterium]
MTRDELATKIKPILEQHPVAKAAFFGSYARGTYSPGSDVDILVEFESPKVGLGFFSLREDLIAAIPMSLDLIYKPGLRHMEASFQKNVEQEALVFYEKNM